MIVEALMVFTTLSQQEDLLPHGVDNLFGLVNSAQVLIILPSPYPSLHLSATAHVPELMPKDSN